MKNLFKIGICFAFAAIFSVACSTSEADKGKVKNEVIETRAIPDSIPVVKSPPNPICGTKR